MSSIKLAKGFCVVLEGSDGSGKTTVCSRLLADLQEEGYDACDFREPGGTPYAEHLRELLKILPNEASVSREATATTFVASRVDLLMTKVIPALKEKQVVLLDRYVPSTITYQKYVHGVDPTYVDKLVGLTENLLTPNLVLYLRVSPETCLKRLLARDDGKDVPSKYQLQQIERGYDAQLQYAYRHPHELPHWYEVNAEHDLDDVVMSASYYVHRELKAWRD